MATVTAPRSRRQPAAARVRTLSPEAQQVAALLLSEIVDRLGIDDLRYGEHQAREIWDSVLDSLRRPSPADDAFDCAVEMAAQPIAS